MSKQKSLQKHRISMWGIILVFVGVVILLQNFDLLPWELWWILWRLWPVLLVIIGLNIIIGRYRPWVAASLILMVLGTSLGLAIWQYPPLLREVISTYSEPRGDLQEVLVQIDFHAGRLSLSTLPPDSPNLVEAVSRRDKLTADFRRQDLLGHLRLSDTREHRRAWRWRGRGLIEWDVELSQDIPLTLTVKLAAANVELDLRYLNVTEFRLELNAGNCEIVMPSSAGDTRVFIDANAANLEIIIPEGVAVRIEVDDNIGIIDIDEVRFPRKGAYYISPNFEQAKNRIYLKINLNVGRIEVL